MGFECIALCPLLPSTVAFSLSLDTGVGSRIFLLIVVQQLVVILVIFFKEEVELTSFFTIL